MWSIVQLIGLGLIGAAATIALLPGHAFASGPVVTLAPAAPYSDGQVVTVSGTGFPVHSADPSGVQILECSDPGGLTSNLPTDNTTCDGSTADPLPVATDASGNFTTTFSVTMTSTVGGVSPINCDSSHFCVLWVGPDYVNAFQSNDAFSSAFEFTGSTTTTTTTSGTTTTTSGTTTTTSGTTTTTTAGTTTTTAGTTTTTTQPPTTTTQPPTTTTTSGTTTTTTSATTTTTSSGTGTTSTTGPATGAAGGTPTGGTGSGSGTVNASSGSLAFTGPPTVLPWLIGFGVIMTVLGALGRRLVPGRVR